MRRGLRNLFVPPAGATHQECRLLATGACGGCCHAALLHGGARPLHSAARAAASPAGGIANVNLVQMHCGSRRKHTRSRWRLGSSWPTASQPNSAAALPTESFCTSDGYTILTFSSSERTLDVALKERCQSGVPHPTIAP